jgi:hypothetical protein
VSYATDVAQAVVDDTFAEFGHPLGADLALQCAVKGVIKSRPIPVLCT